MIIFDFDQTLVDTSSVAQLRQTRRWNEINRRMPQLPPYQGIGELLSFIDSRGVAIAIVSSSPNMIPINAAKLHGWPVQVCVGPHQVNFHQKPAPDGLLYAMRECGASPENTYHVGDLANDTLASRAAGVLAIGSAWGLVDDGALRDSEPDHLFHSVADLHEFFRQVL